VPEIEGHELVLLNIRVGILFRIGLTGGSIAAIKKVEGCQCTDEACRHGIWKSGDRWHFVTVYVSSAEANGSNHYQRPCTLDVWL
jgi:hypothetical protein